jgi:uncharacterized protein (DUF1778 family)
MSPNAQATERLNFRLPREKKHAIEQAAAIRGLSLTDFAILTLYQEAQEVLKSETVTVLSDRDRDAFLNALNNPPAPNDGLLQAASAYKKAKEEGVVR